MPETKLVEKMRKRRGSLYTSSPKQPEPKQASTSHVMISYSWISQPAVKKIVAHLKVVSRFA